MALTEIITPEKVKEVFLFGIDDTDDEGTKFPLSIFYTSIAAAIELAEADLSLVLHGNQRVRNERHDLQGWEAASYYLKTLDKRPILTTNEVAAQYGSFPKNVFPDSWIQVYSPEFGQVQITPGPDSLGSWTFTGGLPMLGLAPYDYTAGWLVYDYTAGWESALTGTAAVELGKSTVTGTDTIFLEEVRTLQYVKIGGEVKRVTKVNSDTELICDSAFTATNTGLPITYMNYPAAIIEAIGLIAALLPLDTAGDLIIGAGISSLSISMDGISQSIQTTSGVENSGYGARIIQYKDRARELMTLMRARYKAVSLMVI